MTVDYPVTRLSVLHSTIDNSYKHKQTLQFRHNENNRSRTLRYALKKHFYSLKLKNNSTLSLSSINSLPYTFCPQQLNETLHLNTNQNHGLKKSKLKITLVGDCIGKSSLCMSFVKNRFPLNYQPTLVENHESKFS